MLRNSLHVRSTGSGPAVFLFHSSGSSGRQWDALAAGLASRFQINAVDLFGHGHSAAWTGSQPMSLADEAAAIVPLLTAYPDGVHLVGHSYGGAVALKVALQLAVTHPHLVRSLTVYEPVLFRLLFDYNFRQPAAQQARRTGASVRAWLQRGQPEAAGRRFVDFWSGAGAWTGIPPQQQKSIATRMPSVLSHFDALDRDDVKREHFARLQIPVLCLSGAKTVAATRRIAELLRFLLPFSMHETLGGMGHMGPITHAPIVNGRIAGFLDAEVMLQQARAATTPRFDGQGMWREAA